MPVCSQSPPCSLLPMPLIPRQPMIFLFLKSRWHFLKFYISGIPQEVLFCLASFAHDNYFEIHPGCCVYQQFIPFYCWVVVHHVFFCFLVFFWSHHEACGILVPWPGIEPGASAVKVQSPNHWTTREFPPSYGWTTFCLSIHFLMEKLELFPIQVWGNYK